MKIAVLGDIHSNIYAFSDCIAHISHNHPDVKKYVFLGDNLTDCPCAKETLDLIYKLFAAEDCIFIRGNREEYLLNIHDGKIKKQYTSSLGSLCYTLDLLSSRDIDFMRKMPISRRILIADHYITFCHGSPTSATEHVYPDNDIFKKARKLCNSDILVAGHNHCETLYKKDGFLYVNPDAVSLVMGRAGVTKYGIIEISESDFNAEITEIKYDNKKLLSDFDTSGILEKGKIYSLAMKESIKTGEDFVYKCAVLGHRLAKADGIKVEKLSLPDKFWHLAAEKLQII